MPYGGDRACLTKGEYWEPAIKNLGFAVTGLVSTRRASAVFGELSIRLHTFDRRLFIYYISTPTFPPRSPAYCWGIPAIGAVRNDGLSEIAETGRVVGKLNLRTPRWIAGNSKSWPQKRPRPRCSREPIAVST